MPKESDKGEIIKLQKHYKNTGKDAPKNEITAFSIKMAQPQPEACKEGNEFSLFRSSILNQEKLKKKSKVGLLLPVA